MPDPRTNAPEPEPDAPSPPANSRRRRRTSVAQTMGGVLFGFEQQVWRTAPPPHELVHHARPDAPVPAGDGTRITIELLGPSHDSDDTGDGPDGAASRGAVARRDPGGDET